MDCQSIGSRILLLISLLIHTVVNNWIIFALENRSVSIANYVIGVVYLFYPAFGLIADIHIARYRMIKLSFILSLLAYALVLFYVIYAQFVQLHSNKALRLPGTAGAIIAVIISVGSLGIYQANAIQFGLQQLQDASSENLSSFIHWYYWCLNLGSLSMYYASMPVLFYYRSCKIRLEEGFSHNGQTYHMISWILFFPVLLSLISIFIGLIVLVCSVDTLDVHQMKINPFKTIFRILRYTWKHKLPERRSALTYWENKIPSRIDFGKQKYGGPFTNEEVEDMKTFFRLLALMLSLFGFFLSDDGHLLSSHVIHNVGCPKLITLLMMVLSPNHIKLLVILIGIPVYEFLVRKFCNIHMPNLLTRIGIGLLLYLIKQLVYLLVDYLVNERNELPISCVVRTLKLNPSYHYSTTMFCLIANAHVVNGNGTCGLLNCPGMLTDSYLFNLLLIPQIIEGLSMLFVFMTMLEFICAQAPQTVKGLLIGIWYAMLSIQYIGINSVNFALKGSINSNELCMYCGVKGFIIFISLLLYSLVCKYYRYRERDEVINEQAIIEEQYERELLYETDNDSESISLLS